MLDILKDIEDIHELRDRYPSDTVIAAASVRGAPITILKAFERDDINNILPVIIVKGIEYGKEIDEDYTEHYEMVRKRVKELYGDTKVLHEPILYSNIELWRLFNVRYAHYLTREYNLLNTCLTCKAFYTLVQVHIASVFNKRIILEEKFNTKKTHFVEDKLRLRFKESDELLFSDFDIEVIRPLSQYVMIDEIKDLLGPEWYFLPNEPKCLFTENWKGLIGQDTTFKTDIPQDVVKEYITPVSSMLIAQLNKDFKIDARTMDNMITNHFKTLKGIGYDRQL